MSYVNDREDIYSMSLTALSQLMEKYNISPSDVGRLEVGTETLLDKSKSVKSVLMQLMGDNADVEGIDTVNACYGGTNALFNAVNWVESSSWDGRLAIVVCGDIAIYSKGAARPTGGAGTVAMVIGPDAPMVLEPAHGSFMEHAYDFYKPDFTSEYPYVDGHFSLSCYVKAVDQCYKNYSAKAVKKGIAPKSGSDTVGLDHFDFNVFHVPTCKLVVKSYARMLYNDFRGDSSKFPEVDQKLAELSYETSLVDKTVEKTFMALTKVAAKEKVEPSLQVPTNTGNMYTGSVYAALASLLTYAGPEAVNGKRIGMFSYGSGLAASMFSIKVVGDVSEIVQKLDIKRKLESRLIESPQEYEKAIELREEAHLKKNFKPKGGIEHLVKGTFYLVDVDDMFKRSYEKK